MYSISVLGYIKHTLSLSVSSREEVEARDEGGTAMGLGTLETFDGKYCQHMLSMKWLLFI